MGKKPVAKIMTALEMENEPQMTQIKTNGNFKQVKSKKYEVKLRVVEDIG